MFNERYTTMQNNVSLDLAGLKAGIYFLKVQDHAGKIGVSKFVKQ